MYQTCTKLPIARVSPKFAGQESISLLWLPVPPHGIAYRADHQEATVDMMIVTNKAITTDTTLPHTITGDRIRFLPSM